MADLTDVEFFAIILPGISMQKLRLPEKFARAVEDRELRNVKLKVADDGEGRLWNVKVLVDDDGDMHLGRGWQQFVRAHDLQVGYFLIFSFDEDTAVFTVKVFDRSMCRKHYRHDDAGSESSSDSDSDSRGTAEMNIDAAPSQFTVTLRQSNLGDKQSQYLNVPVDFQDAHGYTERSKVVLRMGGGSWAVNLKHGRRPRGARTALRYGWHQFCVDNGLGVGDTCFFTVHREGDARRGEDHELKVEVRKPDGTFLE